ncbi:MAG: hypothetical protein A2521_12530 [Deltaproteobacteria bacterium RIFOXYD12_FULL_57_12]|nr:MAG: hypothetical protein A2521_12530 [Deltaproteobacteria bacterium RIFOXYD12_FULL_57_12]
MQQKAAGFGVDLALVHYPVMNKNGETIGSAVTNLDLHDIARAARTFGVDSLYIVTPYEDQQRLAQEIIDHWLTGYGATYNGKRREALSLVRLCSTLAELYDQLTEKWQVRPLVISTCARGQDRELSYGQARAKILAGERVLILFGTGWGLAPEVFAGVDASLPPIAGCGDYNHLSVRSAAAIVLDRLLGNRRCDTDGDGHAGKCLS